MPTLDQLNQQIYAALKDKKPYAYRANSLENLSKEIKVPMGRFIKNVRRYNDFCRQQKDLDFGKNPKFLWPVVEQGPFYAFSLSVGAYSSVGGLQINTENNVIDKDNQVISGLYATGNDAAGLYGDTYNPLMPGDSAGYGYYSGRKAGYQASKYLADQK